MLNGDPRVHRDGALPPLSVLLKDVEYVTVFCVSAVWFLFFKHRNTRQRGFRVFRFHSIAYVRLWAHQQRVEER